MSIPIGGNRLLVNRRTERSQRAMGHLDEGHRRAHPRGDAARTGYLLFVNPFGDNGADLDGEVLFAQDNGPELLTLVEEHPGRHPYLQRADRPIVDLLPSEHPETPDVDLTPMVLLTGDLRVSGTVDPIPGADTTVWWLSVDDEVRLPPSRSPSRSRWMSPSREVDLEAGLHTVDVLVGQAGTTGEAATHPALRRRFYVRAGDEETIGLAPGTAARYVRPPRRSGPRVARGAHAGAPSRRSRRDPCALRALRLVSASTARSAPSRARATHAREGRSNERDASTNAGATTAHSHVARGTRHPTTVATPASSAASGVDTSSATAATPTAASSARDSDRPNPGGRAAPAREAPAPARPRPAAGATAMRITRHTITTMADTAIAPHTRACGGPRHAGREPSRARQG